MKRCPKCQDDHEDDALVCGSCGVELHEVDPAGTSVGSPMVPIAAEARLGTFHPAVAERIAELLYRRAIGHTVVEHDDAAEVRIDATWRDDLRAELTLTWSELMAQLDPGVAQEVRAGGGHAPGWYDAPQGGYIDRAGKLVVSAAEDDDEARVVGPILLTAGAILTVMGWWVLDSGGVLTAGLALVILGIFTPR